MKLQRYNADCYQIIEKEKVVAMAVKLTNGLWILKDGDDKRIGTNKFQKPNQSFDWFINNN